MHWKFVCSSRKIGKRGDMLCKENEEGLRQK